MIILSVILVCLLITGAIIYSIHYENKNTNSKLTEDSQQIDTNVQAPNNEDTKIPTQTTEPTENTPEGLSGSITALSQGASNLEVRVLINSITDEGECKLTITKGSTVIEKVSSIQPQSSSSTCEGFSIPLSDLSAGSWEVEINISSAGRSTTLNGDIAIK